MGRLRDRSREGERKRADERKRRVMERICTQIEPFKYRITNMLKERESLLNSKDIFGREI